MEADHNRFMAIAIEEAKAGAAAERHVGKIVAQIGCLFVGDTGLLQALFIRLCLLRLAEIHVVHFALARALRHSRRFAAGDEAGANPHGVCELERETVVRIEDLHLGNATVIRQCNEAYAAREGAIDIHEQEANALGAGQDVGCGFRHGAIVDAGWRSNCGALRFAQDDTFLVLMARVVVRLFYCFYAAMRLAARGVLKLHGGVIDAVAAQQVFADVAEDAVAL